MATAVTDSLASQLRRAALAHVRAAGDLRQQRRVAIELYTVMDRMWQRIIVEIERELRDEQAAASDASEAASTARRV